MVRLLNEFSLVCKMTEEGEKLCSCDFRINIYGCPNSDFYVFVGKILTAICILLLIMSGGFLVYLTKFKKQSFFLPAAKERGWIRPRPLQSYHLIVFSYMLGEALNLLGLINEWYPSVTWAEFGNILAITMSASFAIFYTVSIVYSTPDVQFSKDLEPLNRDKSPNTRLVDAVGVILFIQPVVTWTPLAILTGHYVEMKDFKMANRLFVIRFLSIIAWQVVYSLIVAYFWYKLMTIIKGYVKVLEERCISSGTTDSNYVESIKRGTKAITVPVIAIIGGLTVQSAIYVVMILTYRNITIYYYWWNLFYYWIEYVAFPLLGLCVESTLLYFTIRNYRESQNPTTSQNSSSKFSSSYTSQTRVNSELDSENNNNKKKTISIILCCGSGSSKNDTPDTDNHYNSPPTPTVIHCTSETVTSIEDIVQRETPSD